MPIRADSAGRLKNNKIRPMVPTMVRSIALISQTPSIHCLVRGLFLKLDTNIDKMAPYLPFDGCWIHHGVAEIVLTNSYHDCGILNPPNLRVEEF